jgi:arginase
MLNLLCVPYHLGRRDVGMGRGPRALLDGGAGSAVQQADPDAMTEWVELSEPFEHEVQADFALQRDLASHVATVRDHGGFPVVLGGNCSCCVGAAAGVGDTEDGGVVWFDAHADAHTPSTTTSGFLEGMPVSVLTGRSWSALASSIPGFKPLPDERVVLVGSRAMEEAERVLVAESGIRLVPPSELSGDAETLVDVLDRLTTHVDSVHLHVDLANEYAADGGPTIPELHHAITTVGERCRVNSVSLTSYNPEVDDDGRALRAGLDLFDTLLGVAAAHATAR